MFDIGRQYRLIVAAKYSAGIAWVKFIGTPADYDKVDAATVEDFWCRRTMRFVAMTRLKPIKTERAYRSALRKARRLFSARPGTAAHDRPGVLGVRIDDDESRRFPIAASDPVDVVKFTMDQKGYVVSDLVRVLGSASRAAEILRRRRRLTLARVDALAPDWGIPADLLVRPYPLAKKAA